MAEPKEETPEEKAVREKRIAEAEEWKRKTEDSIKYAVPRTIEKLRTEAAEKLAEATRLEVLLGEYPNLRKYVGRWEKVAYYTKDVNAKVDRFDLRHNCGCCPDSPVEIWPYLETPHGKVYSEPSSFFVGERASIGDTPSFGWADKFRAAGISDVIIGGVAAHFEQCAADARQAVDDAYRGADE